VLLNASWPPAHCSLLIGYMSDKLGAESIYVFPMRLIALFANCGLDQLFRWRYEVLATMIPSSLVFRQS
jgi:hypothetical protein